MKQSKFESFALAHVLSDYPDDLTYDEVIQLLIDGDESVTVCELYENLWDEHVAQVIEDLKNSAAHWFKGE